MRLTQEDKPVLDVVVGSIKADIINRKWDIQGSVTIKDVAILDYITLGDSDCLIVYLAAKRYLVID